MHGEYPRKPPRIDFESDPFPLPEPFRPVPHHMSLSVSRNDRLSGALFGSLIGDAISLAAHWIYEPDEIRERFGRLRHFADPSSNPYHPDKEAGEFTHYGDQVLCLMESIALCDGFSMRSFERDWRRMWSGYEGYVDGATRNTLRNGRSDSADLAGPARIAPLLVALFEEDEEILHQAVVDQTSLTHGSPDAVDAARYFAVLTRALIEGEDWDAARERAAALPFQSLEFAAIEEAVREQLERPPAEALDKLGRACSVADGFPATLYFLHRFRGSVNEALTENVMAGGDSAARGLVIGMVLGAHHGIGRIPEHWIQELHAHSTVSQWLESRGVDPEV